MTPKTENNTQTAKTQSNMPVRKRGGSLSGAGRGQHADVASTPTSTASRAAETGDAGADLASPIPASDLEPNLSDLGHTGSKSE